LIFAEIFGIRKLESLNIVRLCLRDPVFSRFSGIPTCDRQTHDYGTYRASMASRVKNGITYCSVSYINLFLL